MANESKRTKFSEEGKGTNSMKAKKDLPEEVSAENTTEQQDENVPNPVDSKLINCIKCMKKRQWDEISKTILEELNCVVCYEIPPRPLKTCKNGHLVCDPCIKKMKGDSCPTCKVSLQTRTRNHLSERLVADLEVECSLAHDENGCNKKVKHSQLAVHLALCPFREIPCWQNRCDVVSGSWESAINHMVEKHESQIKKLRYNVYHVTATKTEQYKVNLLTFDGFHFLVSADNYLVNESSYRTIAVRVLGEPGDQKYLAKIEFFNSATGSQFAPIYGNVIDGRIKLEDIAASQVVAVLQKALEELDSKIKTIDNKEYFKSLRMKVTIISSKSY